LRARQVRRYAELGRLLRKYGRSDLVRQAGLDESVAEDDAVAGEVGEDGAAAAAEELAADLEALGPTYVKLGQLLSTRADLLPAPYLVSLARLQDNVAGVSYAEIEEVIETQFGARVSDLFSEFDEKPLAAASLGQVHRARTRDGRSVAVKVQRPGIRDRVVEDLEVLGEVAALMDDHTELGRTFGFGDLLEQFRRSMMAELDYRAEAANLHTMAHHLERFSRIVVPRPVDGLTKSRVLTMDLIDGRKVTDLGPLGLMEIDGSALAEELFSAYVDQILGSGFIHADPHPGNVLITADGDLALIDLGMVTRVSPESQEDLIKMLLALGDGRGREVAQVAERLGTRLDGFDRQHLERETMGLVARHRGDTMAEFGAGAILADLMRVCGEARLRPPPELSMLGKALLNLDEVARTLDPDFDPQAAMRAQVRELFEHRAWSVRSEGHLMRTALEAKEFLEELPVRANRLIDALIDGDLSVKVDAIDQDELLRGIEKVGNHLTTGLVLAAIIIGAALTMRVQTNTRLFGYPAVSIVFFVAAALAGFALVASILTGDRRRKRRLKRHL
jgi:ubiquinone biosynthesis protein